MRVRLPHSNGLFLSQKGTQFTDLRASVPDGKRFCVFCRIEGNVPHLRAKFIHFVGYLPIFSRRKRSRFLLTEQVSSQFASIVFVSAKSAPALIILLVYILVGKEVLLTLDFNFLNLQEK